MSTLEENEPKPTLEQKETNSQPLFEQPIIVEGKRSRKPTARLELTDLSPPRKEIVVPKGRGKPLGQIKFIHHQIENASNDDLQRLNSICFGRRTSKIEAQKNLRDFRGFEFDRKSDEFQNVLKNLLKLKKDQIQSIEEILGLSSTGSTNEQSENILEFLVEPIDHGKSIVERRVTTRPTRTKPKPQKPVQKNDDFYDFDDDEDSQNSESDEDYIGTDEETNFTTNDDPDDFVYQPGKKAPKRKSSLKRTGTSSSSKRKRASTSRTKRNPRKKPEKPVAEEKKPEEKDVEAEKTEENQLEPVEEKKETNQSSTEAEIPVEPEKSSE